MSGGVDSHRAKFHARRLILGAVVLTSEGQERLLSMFDFVFPVSSLFTLRITDEYKEQTPRAGGGGAAHLHPVYAHSQSHLFLSFLITVR